MWSSEGNSGSTALCFTSCFSRLCLGLVLLPRRAGSAEDERSLSGIFLDTSSVSPRFCEVVEGDLLCRLTVARFWVLTLPDLLTSKPKVWNSSYPHNSVQVNAITNSPVLSFPSQVLPAVGAFWWRAIWGGWAIPAVFLRCRLAGGPEAGTVKNPSEAECKKDQCQQRGISGIKDIALPISFLFLGFVFAFGTWRSEERSFVLQHLENSVI